MTTAFAPERQQGDDRIGPNAASGWPNRFFYDAYEQAQAGPSDHLADNKVSRVQDVTIGRPSSRCYVERGWTHG